MPAAPSCSCLSSARRACAARGPAASASGRAPVAHEHRWVVERHDRVVLGRHSGHLRGTRGEVALRSRHLDDLDAAQSPLR